MKGYQKISIAYGRPTLLLGVLAAMLVVCTSAFQFSLVTIDNEPSLPVAVEHADNGAPLSGEKSKADGSKETSRSICTIQAVSQGIQLHISYDPLVWESIDIEVAELKVEVPRQFYKAGWEYFKVLFRDIIAPNAP